MTEPGRSLWQRTSVDALGEDYAHRYAERFDTLAASGADVHGEVASCAVCCARGAACSTPAAAPAFSPRC
jgi:hypothetical protein